jgi:hypothetical protein
MASKNNPTNQRPTAQRHVNHQIDPNTEIGLAHRTQNLVSGPDWTWSKTMQLVVLRMTERPTLFIVGVSIAGYSTRQSLGATAVQLYDWTVAAPAASIAAATCASLAGSLWYLVRWRRRRPSDQKQSELDDGEYVPHAK